ncbi:MAG TPA: hypothetical protein ENJ95_21615 [Bacteroidetes bacterium]|nr:hypothetical protein [Bacteroidota bacterium]
MQIQELAQPTKTAKSGSKRKLERARKMLNGTGVLNAIEEGRKKGETPAQSIDRLVREHTLKPKNAPSPDPFIDAIIDEWCAQTETIEVLNKKIKRLQNKVKKQQARIKELENRSAPKR